MYFIVYDPYTFNHKILYNTIEFYLKDKMTILFTTDIQEIENIEKTYESKNIILLILIDAHFIYSLDENIKIFRLKLYSLFKKIKYKIVYLTEPIDYFIDKKVYSDILKNINPYCIWSYSYHNLKQFTTYPLLERSFIIYPSIFPMSSPLSNYPNIRNKRTDKIVFIGKMNDYRRSIITHDFGDFVYIIDNIYGDELIEIYKTYRFFLNIHRREKTVCLETFRISPILHYGGIVISQDVCREDKKIFENQSIYYENENENLYSLFLRLRSALYINNDNKDNLEVNTEDNSKLNKKNIEQFIEWTNKVIDNIS